MDEMPVVRQAWTADKEVHEPGAARTAAAPRADQGRATEATGRLEELKRDIESNGYDVDAPAVADAILRKIRLLRRTRAVAAANGAGRTPRPPEGPRGR
jgi:anti-sigma28 factor (negative regulator of flagellin synthesis)